MEQWLSPSIQQLAADAVAFTAKHGLRPCGIPAAAASLLLLLVSLFGLEMFLITASSAVLYLTLRTLSEARTARIALLPLLAFLGPGNFRFAMSYCSEQWIKLLVISMIFFLLRLDRRIGREGANLFGMGLALGLMPLVKSRS